MRTANAGATIFDPISITLGDRRIQYVPIRKNPDPERPVRRKMLQEYGPALGMRFLIGLHVAGKPRWTPQDVLKKVRELRVSQLRESGFGDRTETGASVVPQLGFWKAIGDVATGEEPSVSVDILSLSGEADDQFVEHMKGLGWALAEAFYQDQVLGMLNRGGVIEKTFAFELENY